VQAFLDQRGEDFEAQEQHAELVRMHDNMATALVDGFHSSPALVWQQPAGCLMMLRPLQVAKARECEANTGPAGAPQAAGGADAAQEVCIARTPLACARAVRLPRWSRTHELASGFVAS
jgi:hypothetical protein